jgi:methyl-accepting chemotaxis protein
MLRLFLPPDTIERFGLERARRLRIIARTSMVLFVFFVAAGTVTIVSTGRLQFGVPVLALSVLVAVALGFCRAGNALAASWVVLAHIFINVSLVIFLLPYEHFLEQYRYLTFMLALLAIASLIGVERRQLLAISSANLVLFNLAVLLRIIPLEGGFRGEIISAYAAGNLSLIVLGFVGWQSFSFAQSLIQGADLEREKNQKKYDTIRGTVLSARRGIAIGEKLSDASSSSLASIESLHEKISEIDEDIRRLNSDSRDILESNHGLLEQAGVMRDRSEREYEYARRTTESLGTIEETIKQVTNSADEKRAGITAISAEATEKQALLQGVVDAVRRIEDTSGQMAKGIEVIEEMAGRTNLLALNAAVVAARAGEAGSGFSVIAGEIRNLSEETNRNTGEIQAAIQENDEAIANVRSAAQDIADLYGEFSARLKDSAESISELLRGLRDIVSSVASIQEGSGELVQIADQTDNFVESMAADVQGENRALSRIQDLADRIQAELTRISEEFPAIETRSADIKTIGEENQTQITSLFGTIEELAASGEKSVQQDRKAHA